MEITITFKTKKNVNAAQVEKAAYAIANELDRWIKEDIHCPDSGSVLLVVDGRFKPRFEVRSSEGPIVRIWDDWSDDGDATAEGELKDNRLEHQAGGGPEYTGYVTDLNGKKTLVTIN